MKIAVVGTGYVGLTLAILLAQNNNVFAVDIVPEKISMLNNKKSFIADKEIEYFLANEKLDLKGTLDKHEAYKNADFVIIATPTDYDTSTNEFNTQSVETAIQEVLLINPQTIIIIKSTVPVGYTQKLKSKMNVNNIIFSPEFLCEGSGLHDNLYPSRIIIGEISQGIA